MAEEQSVTIRNPALLEQLEPLRHLKFNWDGNGAAAPNETAIENASRVLHVAAESEMQPSRIAASADGGIGIRFRAENKYAYIECFNSADIWVMISDRPKLPETWELGSTEEEFATALSRIREFLNS